MLAVGRALMTRPKLLMMDEPSLGLAPVVIDNLAKAIIDINKERHNGSSGRTECGAGDESIP